MAFPVRPGPDAVRSGAGKEKSGARQDVKLDNRRRRKADKPLAPLSAPSRETRANAREKARAGAAKADDLFGESDDEGMGGGEGRGNNMDEVEERGGVGGGPREPPLSPPPPLSSPESEKKGYLGSCDTCCAVYRL